MREQDSLKAHVPRSCKGGKGWAVAEEGLRSLQDQRGESKACVLHGCCAQAPDASTSQDDAALTSPRAGS